MIDWEIIEDKPEAEGSEEALPPRGRRWRLWALVLGLLLLFTLVAGGSVWWRLRVADEQLREDIEQVVSVEERALRFGLAEQAFELADPTVEQAWFEWYQSTFVAVDESTPMPEVLSIERDVNRVLVTLNYDINQVSWQQARAYRLVNNQWRRTPIERELWGEAVAYQSEHFQLWMAERDAALLSPDALLASLERFHGAFLPLWPNTHDNLITLHFEPSEGLRELYTIEGIDNNLRLPSPLLSDEDGTSVFSPLEQYNLRLANMIATSYGYGRLAQNVEESLLRPALRDALVRQLFLTEEQQKRYRDEVRDLWQAETLAEVNPLFDSAMRTFFAEYLIATEGIDAPYRLLNAYQSESNLEAVTLEITGHSWELLIYGTKRWLKTGIFSPIALEAGGVGEGQLTTFEYDNNTLQRLTLLSPQNQAIALDVSQDASLSVPTYCLLDVKDNVLFHLAPESSARLAVDDVEVMPPPRETWALEPIPEGTQTLIIQEQEGTNILVALDREGNQRSLGWLRGEIEPVLHPREPRFAYLFEHDCGLYIQLYHPLTSRITHIPLKLNTSKRLFWLEDQLFLTENTIESWQLYRIEAQDRETYTMRLYNVNKGQFIGHHFTNNASLIYHEGQLYWAYPWEADTLHPIFAKLPENIELGPLSANGRWLAYIVYHADGQSDLNVLDFRRQKGFLLSQVPPSAALGELAWAPAGEEAILAAVEGELGVDRTRGNLIKRYEIVSDSNLIRVEEHQSNTEVDHLHWCGNERLFYRVTDGNQSVLVEQRGDESYELAEGEWVVGCPSGD